RSPVMTRSTMDPGAGPAWRSSRAVDSASARPSPDSRASSAPRRRDGSRRAGRGVASVYVTNGREVDSEWFAEKLAFLDAIAERVAAERGSPLVIAGDFNVAREDRDVYDPAAFLGATHVTAAERTRFERVLSDGALVDAYRLVHPDETQFTWWDYRQGHFHRDLGLRIDYILVCEPIARGLAECSIARDYRKGK